MSDRSGTETRQRTAQINVRLTPAEHATVLAIAEERGVTPSELLRRSVVEVEWVRKTIRMCETMGNDAAKDAADLFRNALGGAS